MNGLFDVTNQSKKKRRITHTPSKIFIFYSLFFLFSLAQCFEIFGVCVCVFSLYFMCYTHILLYSKALQYFMVYIGITKSCHSILIKSSRTSTSFIFQLLEFYVRTERFLFFVSFFLSFIIALLGIRCVYVLL